MLTSLKLENFQSYLNPQEIKLRPITLIFGKNNSGKSTILKTIRLLKQSLIGGRHLITKSSEVDMAGQSLSSFGNEENIKLGISCGDISKKKLSGTASNQKEVWNYSNDYFLEKIFECKNNYNLKKININYEAIGWNAKKDLNNIEFNLNNFSKNDMNSFEKKEFSKNRRRGRFFNRFFRFRGTMGRLPHRVINEAFNNNSINNINCENIEKSKFWKPLYDWLNEENNSLLKNLRNVMEVKEGKAGASKFQKQPRVKELLDMIDGDIIKKEKIKQYISFLDTKPTFESFKKFFVKDFKSKNRILALTKFTISNVTIYPSLSSSKVTTFIELVSSHIQDIEDNYDEYIFMERAEPIDGDKKNIDSIKSERDTRVAKLEEKIDNHRKKFKFFKSVEPYTLLRETCSKIINNLRSVDSLSAYRSKIQRYFQFNDNHGPNVGKEAENFPNLLYEDINKFKDTMNTWIRKLGIDGSVDIKKIKNMENYFEIGIRKGKKGKNYFTNILDAGYGLSAALPIIMSSYNKESKTLLLEEPEVHLHPKAQSALADIILEACKFSEHRTLQTNQSLSHPYFNRIGMGFRERYIEPTQFIIETHSEHIILRLLKHVRDGNLLPDFLSVNYVQMDDQGVSTIHNIPINEDGEFKVEWPEGFFEDSLENL